MCGLYRTQTSRVQSQSRHHLLLVAKTTSFIAQKLQNLLQGLPPSASSSQQESQFPLNSRKPKSEIVNGCGPGKHNSPMDWQAPETDFPFWRRRGPSFKITTPTSHAANNLPIWCNVATSHLLQGYSQHPYRQIQDPTHLHPLYSPCRRSYLNPASRKAVKPSSWACSSTTVVH